MSLVFSNEVARAKEQGAPIVALESSVITQGLPRPENLASARACEEVIRGEGAIPATLALLDGAVKIGLSGAELEHLANLDGAWKLGARDLGVAMAKRASGGTTVSATLALAAQAGIRVFATGGIGGVHRGDPSDVSADLHALARYRLAVVCAGAKSILDLPRTLELLETLGVPVIGLSTNEFPAFYADACGLPLEACADSEVELAEMVARHWELGGAGVLAVQPCPREAAVPAEEIERAVQAALSAAESRGIRGKAITPFLLGEVARATGGKSKRANLALLENNARAAARLAVQLASA